MLITLNQLKASLVAFKNWVLARIPSKTSDLTNDSNFITTADIPISSDSTLGLAKPVQEYGTISDRNGGIAINSASSSEIREGRNSFKPIVPYSQHDAVYYGLIKIANDTDRRYSAEDATAIRAMIGSPSTLDIPTRVSDLVDDSGHYTKPSTGIPASDLASGVVPVQDVRINMGSLLDSEGVANIPIATYDSVGVVKVGSGLDIDNGSIYVMKASTKQVKAGTASNAPIVPYNQHQSVFYGLASASGDTTQSASSNPVGTYTDSAKTSIKTMLGVEDPVDVQINGTSIVDNGVAEIPLGGLNTLGLVSYDNQYGNNGIIITSSGAIRTQGAGDAQIKLGVNGYCPIPPTKQHMSTFYGLAKAAGDTTQSASSNAVGTYTDEAKASIQNMLGVNTAINDSLGIIATEFDATQSYVIGDYVLYEGKLYRFTADHATGMFDGTDAEEVTVAGEMISDVAVNGTSIVNNGVANIPVASTNTFGVVKVPNIDNVNGIKLSNGMLYTVPATSANAKNGDSSNKPVVPLRQHESVFYGLAKIAGHDEKDSTLAVGTYTDEAKAAIKTMLGVEDPVDVQINGTSIVDNGVANIPKATYSTLGVIKPNMTYGTGVNDNGELFLSATEDSNIKAGINQYKPIPATKQHLAVFYGLAKAAGDTTQSASSNAVGTYTDEAKAAIKTMLGIDTITVDSIPTTEIDTLFA